MDWCRCGKGWKTSEAIQRQGLGAGFQLSGHTPGMALGSVVKWAVGPYCGSGDASLIHDEFTDSRRVHTDRNRDGRAVYCSCRNPSQ
jgi:hypothetical protein